MKEADKTVVWHVPGRQSMEPVMRFEAWFLRHRAAIKRRRRKRKRS